MTPTELTLLRSVIDRIIPADPKDPGALALHTDRYVLHILETDAAHAKLPILEGLATLPENFSLLPPETQDALLLDREHKPWFRTLVELTSEGFYANPSNQGNASARSWQMINYHPRLPEGPEGPPRLSPTDP